MANLSTISFGAGVKAWQANCQHCGSRYLVAHKEQSDGARVRFCAVCGELAVYVLFDNPALDRGTAELNQQ